MSIVNCQLSTVNCQLHILSCMMHTAHCILHTAHNTQHTAHCTLQTTHCTLHTAHYDQHNAHCSLHLTAVILPQLSAGRPESHSIWFLQRSQLACRAVMKQACCAGCSRAQTLPYPQNRHNFNSNANWMPFGIWNLLLTILT